VELYSAFIYRGWGVANAIAQELVAELDRHSDRNVAEIPRAFAPGAA
jgi:dihydroorotate dehydrogenase